MKMIEQTVALMNSNITRATVNEWKNKVLQHQVKDNYNNDEPIDDKDLFSDEDYNEDNFEGTKDHVAVSGHRRLRHKVGYRNGERVNIDRSSISSSRYDDSKPDVRRMKGKRKKYPKATYNNNEANHEKSIGRSYSTSSYNPFKDYTYDLGNCPNAGSQGVPCAVNNLKQICDKYDRTNGSFKACYEACQPAFCCAHDAKNNYLAEPCQSDENCAQYSWCYIVWWKLHNTIGPAVSFDFIALV